MSISGANTIPLRKLNPILTGERTFSGPSLLRPSMSASRPTAMQAMQMVGPRPNAMQMVGPRPNAMQMVGPRPNAMQMVGPRPNAMQMLGPRPNAMMVGPRPNMVQPQQMLMAPQLPPMPVMAQKHDVQETLNAIQHHGTPLQRKREVEDPSSDRKKKRRSRWGGDDKDKAFIPGMPTILPPDIKPEQEKAYLLQLQIEEITRRLRSGDLGISPNPEDRSPSPEPIYNNEGKRLNTREYRTRKKLEEERHTLILEIALYNPEFKPPSDYKPPIIRVNDKVMIPQEEHPEINFVGLLIGPRGNTLKNLEKDTGAKIIIRGKGSVKEGKIGRKDGQPLPGEDEPI